MSHSIPEVDYVAYKPNGTPFEALLFWENERGVEVATEVQIGLN